MSDQKTTVEELREMVGKFRRARGWTEDQNAKNKAISLVIEAVELLEHFQWRESSEILKHKQRRQEVVDELADVFYWVLTLADNLEIDLSQTLKQKLKQGEKKYPAERFPKELSEENLESYYKLRDRVRRRRRRKAK